MESVRSKMRAEIWPTYLMDVKGMTDFADSHSHPLMLLHKVWTPIQIMNFRFVPVSWQPVVVNVGNIGLLWGLRRV